MSKTFGEILIDAVKVAAKDSPVETEINESLRVELSTLDYDGVSLPALEFIIDFDCGEKGIVEYGCKEVMLHHRYPEDVVWVFSEANY